MKFRIVKISDIENGTRFLPQAKKTWFDKALNFTLNNDTYYNMRFLVGKWTTFRIANPNTPNFYLEPVVRVGEGDISEQTLANAEIAITEFKNIIQCEKNARQEEKQRRREIRKSKQKIVVWSD